MQIMLAFSGLVTGYWWLILGLLIVSAFIFRKWVNSEDGRLSWDKRKLNLPVIGSMLHRIEVSRFSRTLGTLLKSAVPLISSINIVREIVNNKVIASSMEDIKSGVKKGDGLARPIRESGVFPPFAVHLLEVGEETGRLDDMLLQIADTYDREMRTAIKRVTALFEPAMILLMGLIIGIMVVSMLYSILSINDLAI